MLRADGRNGVILIACHGMRIDRDPGRIDGADTGQEFPCDVDRRWKLLAPRPLHGLSRYRSWLKRSASSRMRMPNRMVKLINELPP